MKPVISPSEKRHKRVRFVLIAGIVISVLLSPFAIVAGAGGRDKFRFLGGRTPFWKGVIPGSADRYFSKWRSDEYRAYTWKQDFFEVADAVAQELTPKGFVKERIPPGGLLFKGPGGVHVWIEAMRSSNRREALEGNGVRDPQWVTVISTDPIPDTWLAHLRYALETNWW